MAVSVDWVALRDQAVMIGMLSRAVSVEQIEAWIQHGERSLAIGPMLDPTLAMLASGELEKQLRFMRAFLTFRREVEAIALTGPVAEVTE